MNCDLWPRVEGTSDMVPAPKLVTASLKDSAMASLSRDLTSTVAGSRIFVPTWFFKQCGPTPRERPIGKKQNDVSEVFAFNRYRRAKVRRGKCEPVRGGEQLRPDGSRRPTGAQPREQHGRHGIVKMMVPDAGTAGIRSPLLPRAAFGVAVKTIGSTLRLSAFTSVRT
jgi:hypothetical protein